MGWYTYYNFQIKCKRPLTDNEVSLLIGTGYKYLPMENRGNIISTLDKWKEINECISQNLQPYLDDDCISVILNFRECKETWLVFTEQIKHGSSGCLLSLGEGYKNNAKNFINDIEFIIGSILCESDFAVKTISQWVRVGKLDKFPFDGIVCENENSIETTINFEDERVQRECEFEMEYDFVYCFWNKKS